jgi:hypothetical protein
MGCFPHAEIRVFAGEGFWENGLRGWFQRRRKQKREGEVTK